MFTGFDVPGGISDETDPPTEYTARRCERPADMRLVGYAVCARCWEDMQE